MSDKGKISRKDLKKPDEFIQQASKLYNWVADNQKQIIYAIIGLIAIVIGTVLAVNYSESQESKAASLVYEAEQILKTSMEEENNKNKAGNLENAKKNLELVIKDYSSTDSAAVASFYMGNIYYEEKKHKEAIESYEKAMKKFGGDNDRLKAVIMTNLAYSHGGMGDLAKSCDYFEKISKMENIPAKDMSYFRAGQCLAKLKKKKEAKDYYKMILNEYPNSKLKDKVNLLLAGNS